jgi:predicted DNA-binding protein
MWNSTKPPSVRELASRIDAARHDAAVLRGEQRELQAALEAEQGQRLAALSEHARRVDVLVQSLNAMHDRLEEVFERCENLMLATNVNNRLIDGILARLAALEGSDIPAAPVTEVDDVASSLPDIGGGDTTTEPEPETGDLLSSVPAEDATMADAPVAVLEEVR